MLSDIGSWASIIGFILSFLVGFGVCKFSIKKNTQENKNSSFMHKGDNHQCNSQ